MQALVSILMWILSTVLIVAVGVLIIRQIAPARRLVFGNAGGLRVG